MTTRAAPIELKEDEYTLVVDSLTDNFLASFAKGRGAAHIVYMPMRGLPAAYRQGHWIEGKDKADRLASGFVYMRGEGFVVVED